MTPKTFAALAAAAAVSLAAALLVHASQTPSTGETTSSGKALPDLQANAGKVQHIAVTQGGKPLTIERVEDRWLITSQGGYPANAEKVRNLITALSDAKLLEPKTKSPARYALLEVGDPAEANSNARLIKLEDSSGKPLAEIIAGKQRPGGGATSATGQQQTATYVRRPNEEQSWLASTDIAGGATLKDWADARVFELPTEKIKDVTVSVTGESPYMIKRASDGSHELQDIPEGKRIKYVNMVDNILEAASFLDLTKVRKATATPGGDAGTVSFETDDGLKLSLKVRREKDGVWVTVDPSGEGAAKAKADEIRTRTAGWEFETLPSKADTMLKKKSDLMEDVGSDTTPDAAMPPGMSLPGMPPLPQQ